MSKNFSRTISNRTIPKNFMIGSGEMEIDGILEDRT
jgi:hypothetical protein